MTKVDTTREVAEYISILEIGLIYPLEFHDDNNELSLP